MRYLICESDERARGISRETYVKFMRRNGCTNYETESHPVDAFGVTRHPDTEDSRVLLNVDPDSQYYQDLPAIHQTRLANTETVTLEGWDVVADPEPE